MFELKSIFDIGNALEKKGYDVFVEKQTNGLYKCWVWHNEECLGLGKIEYDTWNMARNTTLKKIYNKILPEL